MKDIISKFTLKELEQLIFRSLQITFSEVMAKVLTEMDQIIAEGRDKNRFELKDKRVFSFESMFGSVELRRNYYRDRET